MRERYRCHVAQNNETLFAMSSRKRTDLSTPRRSSSLLRSRSLASASRRCTATSRPSSQKAGSSPSISPTNRAGTSSLTSITTTTSSAPRVSGSSMSQGAPTGSPARRQRASRSSTTRSCSTAHAPIARTRRSSDPRHSPRSRAPSLAMSSRQSSSKTTGFRSVMNRWINVLNPSAPSF